MFTDLMPTTSLVKLPWGKHLNMPQVAILIEKLWILAMRTVDFPRTSFGSGRTGLHLSPRTVCGPMRLSLRVRVLVRTS